MLRPRRGLHGARMHGIGMPSAFDGDLGKHANSTDNVPFNKGYALGAKGLCTYLFFLMVCGHSA